MTQTSDELFADLNSLNDDEENRESYVRAPMGWPGGKMRSLHHILPHLPYRRKFIEVMGGSGIVILNRKPSEFDVYNDRYGGVVAFYRCVRDPVKLDQLLQRLELTCYSREEFVWCKETWEGLDDQDDVERAARWWYAREVSFSNMGRAFARGTNSGNMCGKLHSKLQDFYPVHQRLKQILIENLDCVQCIRDFDSYDAVFYVDPPYLLADSGCYKQKFNYSDHVRLLDAVFAAKGFVAVSHWPHPLYDTYKWDRKFEWEIITSIDVKERCTNSTRIPIQQECLWIKESTT